MALATTTTEGAGGAQAAARNRYLSDAVETMTPGRLVTMLYDALASDLDRAESAIADRDFRTTNDRLVRAQAIILELRSGLKPDAWSGGKAMLSLYDYWHAELLKANLRKDAGVVRVVRAQVLPVLEAWHQAATEVATKQ
jgi:flagellar protein FliS